MSIRVLTLWPEWAWAICALDKRVENRTWNRGARVGDTIAIHAGRCVGGGTSQRAYRAGVRALRDSAAQAGWRCQEIASPDALVAGTFPLLRFIKGAQNVPFAPPRGAIIALALLTDILPPQADDGNDPWGDSVMYRWLLADVRPLATPIPCHGQQGLWEPRGLTARLLDIEVARCQRAAANRGRDRDE